MVAPSALLSIQDGSGAIENQGQGFIQDLTPGDSVTFRLQTPSSVVVGQRWVLVFESRDSEFLNGLAFVWAPPAPVPAFQFTLPPFGFVARYVTTIYDEQNALSQFTGEIVGSEVASGNFWPFNAAIAANITNPVLGQSAAPSGGGQTISMFAQDAAVGSAASGGTFAFYNGYTDGAASPSRFTVWQPLAQNQASPVKMFELFLNDQTNVMSCGIGDSTAGLGGTQLVLQGASSSLVNHAYIGMFALDNATHGQCFIQIHDVDGTNTIPGAYYCYYDVATTSTQNDSGMFILRNVISVGTGGSRYIDVNNNVASSPVRRWDLREIPNTGGGTTDQANMGFYSSAAGPSQTKSYIQIPWGDSTVGAQGIISQRNATNSGDLNIIRRAVGNLYFGDQVDTNQLRFEHDQAALFENADTTAGAAGWQFQNATLGRMLRIGSEAIRPIYFWGGENTHDGVRYSFNAFDGSGNGTQFTLYSVTLIDNAVTELFVRIVARDSVTTTDFAIVELKSGYSKASGAISSPTAAGTPVDVAHTTAAASVAASVSFTVNSGRIDIKATCWTAHTVHFDVYAEESINVGVA